MYHPFPLPTSAPTAHSLFQNPESSLSEQTRRDLSPVWWSLFSTQSKMHTTDGWPQAWPILRISLISSQCPTENSSSLCYDKMWPLTAVWLENKSLVSRHYFFYLMKGWKEWGDENVTDTSESVLKMFSFLRENVLRLHCPQHAFHCLEPPRVSFSYFWWLWMRRGSNFSPKVLCYFNQHWSLIVHALSAYIPM